MKALKGLIDLFTSVLTSPYRSRHERRPAPKFVVYHSTGPVPKQENIKDISSTGVYLLTDERWLPGTPVFLTVQRRGPLEENPSRSVTLHAKAVRWGKDGVGLSFALPKNLNFHLWRSVLESSADHRDPEDILPPFRMATGLAFLSRICPLRAEEIRHLVRSGLGNLRFGNAIEIAVNAERLLQRDPDSNLMRAHTQVVFRIIEDGSWADEDWLRQLWGGLLAASCSPDGREETDTTMVDRFGQLAPVHARIFKEACSRATKVISAAGTVSSNPLICDFGDLQRVTGSQSLAKIEGDIRHLSDLGLLLEARKSRSFSPSEEINITPTPLGLMTYARCHGHRGALKDFYFPAA